MHNSIEILLANEKFTQAFPSLIRALKGDVLTAVVLQAINYRSHISKADDDGEVWVDLRIQELADEIGISKQQTQRALNKLRENGLLMEKQVKGYNNAKMWRIDFDGLIDLQNRLNSNLNRNRIINKSNPNNQKIESEVSTLYKEVNKNIKNTRDYSDEVHNACKLLADLIEQNGSKRPNIGNKWLQEMDRLNRLDGRSWQQIESAIRWSQEDSFWKSNILSPDSLRQKYDQMRLQAQRGQKQSAVTKTLNWLTNINWDDQKEIGK